MTSIAGTRQPLIDGVEKVTGRARYTADLPARALTGEILPDGTFRSMLGKLTRRGVELGPQNLDARAAHLVYFADDRPAPIELGGSRVGDRVDVELTADPVYVAAELDGRRWLVGWRRTWRWE